MNAIVAPQVTRDLPVQPVQFKSSWSHLTGLYLADSDFGRPGKIDILLGIDIYTVVTLQGRQSGPPGTPLALETKFGWVLAGKTTLTSQQPIVGSHHATVCSGDDILRKFWEIEEGPKDGSNLTPEEQAVTLYFQNTHSRTEEGRFVVPLPKDPQARPLGESRAQAVRRFMTMEHNLHSKGQFPEFAVVMKEYMQLEPVTVADL